MSTLSYDTVYKMLHRFYWDSKGDEPKEIRLSKLALDELVEACRTYKLGKAIHSLHAVTGVHSFHGVPVTIDQSLPKHIIIINP